MIVGPAAEQAMMRGGLIFLILVAAACAIGLGASTVAPPPPGWPKPALGALVGLFVTLYGFGVLKDSGEVPGQQVQGVQRVWRFAGPVILACSLVMLVIQWAWLRSS